jgi:hypothetical protein
VSAQPSIVNKIVVLHRAFNKAGLAHAFGGALALAWCTQQARGTIDIDVNVFVDSSRSAQVFDALPHSIARTDADLERCLADGQVRLWWDETPVDLFTNTTGFHESAAERAVVHEFAGQEIAFLSCTDLAVFKAFFNRTRDWADLEDMLAVGTLDIDRTLGVLVRYLGVDDERVRRLRDLAQTHNGPESK